MRGNGRIHARSAKQGNVEGVWRTDGVGALRSPNVKVPEETGTKFRFGFPLRILSSGMVTPAASQGTEQWGRGPGALHGDWQCPTQETSAMCTGVRLKRAWQY